MKNLIINNKEYNPSEICTLNLRKYLEIQGLTEQEIKDKAQAQRKAGLKVISSTYNALKYATGTSIYNEYNAVPRPNFKCIIHYGNPSEFMETMLNDAYYNKADVYCRIDNQFIEYEPTANEKTARDRYLEKKEYNKQAEIAHKTAIEELYKGRRIPEARKAKMIKYIRYYELEIPTSEPEWVETFEQLAYYIRNKVDYAFDKNQYEICEECGDLIHRGVEHCCYCELPEERSKMDYIVNGGE